MPNLLLPFGAFVLLGSVAAFTPTPPPAVGPGAITALLERMFAAFDSGDRAAVHACMVDKDCPFPVQIYDLDPENKPVAIEGLEHAHRYLDGLLDTVKTQGLKVETKITKIHPDCSSPQLGYATFEFEQKFTAGEQTQTFHYRATALVSWGKDESKGPRLFHWHSSLGPTPTTDGAKALPAASSKK